MIRKKKKVSHMARWENVEYYDCKKYLLVMAKFHFFNMILMVSFEFYLIHSFIESPDMITPIHLNCDPENPLVP